MVARLMKTIRPFLVFVAFLATCALFTAPTQIALADTPPPQLAPALAPIAFLLGRWASDNGKVAETGETSSGLSQFTTEAGGAAIVRRDHTELANAAGNSTGSFDQIMLIYPEGATIHADYTDGTHVIHYVSAKVVPDASIEFTSAARPGMPTYRLTYDGARPGSLGVRFEIEPPGASEFHPIATGTLHRAKT